MIEKMKKVTLLVTERERDRFLSELRQAGVVHVKAVKDPSVESLDDTSAKADRAGKAIAILKHYATSDIPPAEKQCENVWEERIENVITAWDVRGECLKNIEALKKSEQWYSEWGEFDPRDMKMLKDNRVNIRLYRLGKHELEKIKEETEFHVIKKHKERIYGCLVSADPEKELDLEEIGVPLKSPGEIADGIKELTKAAGAKDDILKSIAQHTGGIKKFKQMLEKRKEFLEVKFGMAEEDRFTYLCGFCPEKYLGKVTALSRKSSAGYLIEDGGDPAEVPTLITNPRWLKIIDPVFKFMGTVPGYEEFDISFVFLIFFSLFFAMLVGDAAYGLIFLFATLTARKVFKKVPPEIFKLLYLLSGATILWGIVTGTWFGSEGIARLPVFNKLIIGKISSFGPDNQNFMMYLSFIIGVVHLTIAHVKRFIRVINSPMAIAQAGWIAILWGMFFTAGTLIISKPFPPFVPYLLIGGITMVLVFENYQKNVLKGMGTTIASLPLNVISSFSDIVSYLRLFAVGYATVIVAESFNTMAVGGGIKSVFAGLIAALILFTGHALNITLSIMAVIVHGIRLNVLEFSGHLGMQWTGKEYAPFRE